MNIQPFHLERYFAKYEFTARYLLSSSDCEAMAMTDLLAMADHEMQKMWRDLHLGYTETLGHPLLRDEIVKFFPNLGADDTLVLAPEEGIFLLLHALLEPGDHVVCIFPGYQSLYEVARSIGCQVSLWQPDEEDGWRFNVDELSGILRPNTRLVIVNFPHNPTGYIPPKEDFSAIIDLVRERGIHMLSDEMYRYLESEDGITLPPACSQYEKAVSLFGLSKTFGLPGLRIGWLASRDADLLDKVSRLKDYTTICSSAPSEILGIIALRNSTELIQQQNQRIRRNLDMLADFINGHPEHFRWNPPRGGSICFPRMTLVENTYNFCIRLVEDTGILLVPSRLFEYGDHHVRIGFGKDNLPQVLGLFGEYLEGQ